jgi:hypothetical protein
MAQLEQLQVELALKQAIDRQLDALVRRANQTVLILSAEPRGLKENQLRNVVNVAGHADSIEALLNFIRYQIARERGWRIKRSGDPKDFGHQVIADIQTEVRAAALRAAQSVHALLGTAAPGEEDLFHQAYPRMAEQYLAYLNRAFYYCEKIDGGYTQLAALPKELINASAE